MITFAQAVKKYSKDNDIHMTAMFKKAGVDIRSGVSYACNHNKILEADYKKICATFRLREHSEPQFVNPKLSKLRRDVADLRKNATECAKKRTNGPANAEVAFRHAALKVPERYLERGFRYQQASLALLLDAEIRSKALEFVHAAQDMGYNIQHMVRTLEAAN